MKKFDALRNELYYKIWFRPTRTVNSKMKGNEHYMTNDQLAEMRTRQVIQMFTFRNVLIIKLHKLKQRVKRIYKDTKPKHDRL